MNRSIGSHDRREQVKQLDLSQRTMLMPRSPIRSGKRVGMHNGRALLDMDMRKERHAAVIGQEQQRQKEAQIFPQ